MLLLGILMIVSGIMLLMVESMMRERRYDIEKTEMPADRRGEIRGGAVVMIGPLPVVIGSDQRMAAMLMALAIALMALWLVSAYLGDLKP
ncbi:TIGR00304 family membrane protein [Methanothrix sp.]|uniref:TIGR00304 family membrane protein n=1 Tax=Methanothrix sp. TaxID=90426 RepID=UPI0034E2D750